MAEMSKEGFKRTHRKEKDPRMVERTAAANMAHYSRRARSARPIRSCSVRTESDVGKAV